jgi:hypothetical protein
MGGCGAADGNPPPGGLGVSCLVCDGPLFFLPDCYPLIFRCANSHCLTLEDLLSHDLPRGAVGPGNQPRAALDNWKSRARILHELSERALRNGHAFMAADFQEAAHRIEGWVSSLRSLLAKSGRPGPLEG